MSAGASSIDVWRATGVAQINASVQLVWAQDTYLRLVTEIEVESTSIAEAGDDTSEIANERWRRLQRWR